MAALPPNKERDRKLRDELRKALPKEAEEKLVDDYSEYRTFLDRGVYSDTQFLK